MEHFEQAQAEMVELLRRHYGLRDARVLAAMEQVPRPLYIPAAFRRDDACGDHPCPIGHGQTISQPFIVAYMTSLLALQPGEKVLEVGTGSGYQTAVLAALGARVFSIEVIPELAAHAAAVFKEQGVTGVQLRCGDGHAGWPEEAPFDAIIATCAPDDIPTALADQLAEGGRMVAPVGDWSQRLVLLHRQNGRLIRCDDIPVRFVPMVRDVR
jgi:protein-L-isoaspartate(D-aspartate) O-methyltransferase